MVWFRALSLAVARLQLSYYPERAFCRVGEDGGHPGRADSIAVSQCALPIKRAMEKHFCLSGHFTDGRVEAWGKKK